MRSTHLSPLIAAALFAGACSGNDDGAVATTTADALTGSTCDPATLRCASAAVTTPMSAQIKRDIATEIDTGMMDKGLIKVRARFTIDPVDSDPIVALEMTSGGIIDVTWPEKGTLDAKPILGAGGRGFERVHFTLTPKLEAGIYGFNISYDATDLLNRIPGASFDYDSQANGPLLPWGFTSAGVQVPPPPLDSSTIFSIGFDSMGIPSDIVEGQLAIQAAAKPIFKFTTKEVRIDSGSATSADGAAKITVGDVDGMDLGVFVKGEVQILGTLDVKPTVKIDSVDGFPTFGLVKFGFSVVSKEISGTPIPIALSSAKVHIPLPNVKVPTAPVDMGSAKSGEKTEKTVHIDSTGEMGGLMTFTSSDPQFVVPQGEIKVDSKGSYDLKVAFNPAGDGPASANITVKSNDPSDPEQVFRVAANGAPLGDPNDPNSKDKKSGADNGATIPNSGCAAVKSADVGLGNLAPIGVGLGLAAILRRRRQRR